MKKNVTVIIKKTHPNIGNMGEIVKLAPGYVFNYLIPRDLVTIPTPGQIKHLTMFNLMGQRKKERITLESNKVLHKIEKISKIYTLVILFYINHTLQIINTHIYVYICIILITFT